MRKFIAILLMLVSVISGFESCTSYENGPAFSFLTPKKRAVGEWHLVDLLVNDKREQALFDKESTSVLILNEDGSYSYVLQLVVIQNVRIEHSVDAAEILKVKHAMEKERPNLSSSIITYHLETDNINRYKTETYEEIYRH